MTSSRQYVGLLGDSNSDGSEGTFLEADAVKLVPTFAPSGYFSIRYIHGDHLGTPQFVTDDTGQVIWSARYQPFGEATIDEDPDGDGTDYSLNLRFAGQYFDSESGLNYNYFRDYDPTIGRYLESDPIGFLGGPNAFSYSTNNPIAYFDQYGLWIGSRSGWGRIFVFVGTPFAIAGSPPVRVGALILVAGGVYLILSGDADSAAHGADRHKEILHELIEQKRKEAEDAEKLLEDRDKAAGCP
jgi:RHS repeat-associated protein